MTQELKRFIKKYGAIFGFISLIITIITVPTSLYFSYRADYLAQVNSNFTPKIIEYNSFVHLDGITNQNWLNNEVVVTHGTFTVELIVITPHAGIVSFTNKPSFAFEYDPQYPSGFFNWQYIISENKSSLTTVGETDSYSDQYNSIRRFFVSEGITQVNFTLPIAAQFYPNSWVKNESSVFGERLGNLTTSISFMDVQTQQTIVTQLSPVEVWVDFNNSLHTKDT
jgi:hypothetical protein